MNLPQGLPCWCQRSQCGKHTARVKMPCSFVLLTLKMAYGILKSCEWRGSWSCTVGFIDPSVARYKYIEKGPFCGLDMSTMESSDLIGRCFLENLSWLISWWTGSGRCTESKERHIADGVYKYGWWGWIGVGWIVMKWYARARWMLLIILLNSSQDLNPNKQYWH